MNLGSEQGSSVMLPLADELPLLTVLGDVSGCEGGIG